VTAISSFYSWSSATVAFEAAIYIRLGIARSITIVAIFSLNPYSSAAIAFLHLIVIISADFLPAERTLPQKGVRSTTAVAVFYRSVLIFALLAIFRLYAHFSAAIAFNVVIRVFVAQGAILELHSKLSATITFDRWLSIEIVLVAGSRFLIFAD